MTNKKWDWSEFQWFCIIVGYTFVVCFFFVPTAVDLLIADQELLAAYGMKR